MLCLAIRFAVLCCAALRVFLNVQQQLLVVVVPGMIHTHTRFMYVFCVLVFLLSSVDCPSSVPMSPPPANIARTAVQNATSTSTQHSAGQLALHKHFLALLLIRYSHQIITGLFFLPYLFTCSASCIFPCASVAGGVSSLAEQSPVLL